MENKKLIGITGPSSFSEELIKMVETHLKANFVILYHNESVNLDFWLSCLHGVILGGGVDIHPTIYGVEVKSRFGLSKFNLDRDLREIHIIEHCIQNKVPMLGICRGHQMLGIYHGIELCQDIGDSDIAHTPHKQGIVLNENEPVHTVKLIGDKTKAFFNSDVPDERKSFNRFKKFDAECIWVNSYHHQALKYIANVADRKTWQNNELLIRGIAETGMKECPEIIELMAGKGRPWISCQWHPEVDYKYNTPSRKVVQKFNDMVEYAFKNGKQ